MRKLTFPLLAILLVAAACSSTEDPPQVTGPTVGADDGTDGNGADDPVVELDPDDIRLLSRLVPFRDCDELLKHLKDEARERVGPYGLDYFGGGFFRDEIAVLEETGDFGDDAASEAEADRGTAGRAPQAEGGDGDAEYTGTNVQEAGVDEPDLVKTDGERILVVSENVLTYVDVSSGDPEKTDSIRIPEGWGHEMFFQGDRALLFTNGGTFPHPIPLIEGDADVAESTISPEWYPAGAAIIEVDLSDPDDLEIVATLKIQGQYLSARRVGDTVRLALTSPPNQLPWVYPSTPASEERAERFNRQLIDETTIEDWIPRYELTDDEGTTTGPLLDCDRLHRPGQFSGFDVVSVLSFDLDGGVDRGDGVRVLAGGQTVYASTDRFYVATTAWAGQEVQGQDGIVEWEENYTTNLHAFAIETDEAASYVASGSVEGSLLNQFSMDEHDGYLRVITTDGSPWNRQNQSETSLVVLEEDGDELTEVGRVGGLGKGETLFSARLLDDVGFAVTFRQIDPFYVLDLRDPENPEVTGELKIPGFSTYLHPIEDDYVAGVGQHATDEGRTLGLKVSLFDVSDPGDPAEVDTWILEGANSPVEYDHRAFQFLPDRGLAIVPFSLWSGQTNGAALLRIEDGSITDLGRVTHTPATVPPTSDCRVLGVDDLPEDTELFFIAQDVSIVQYCGPNDTGGYGSWYCDVIPLADLRFWGDLETMDELIDDLTGGRFDPDQPDDDRVEICWPDGGTHRYDIQRSLVIDDTLWTMSPTQLQANDLDVLDDLPVEAVIELG